MNDAMGDACKFGDTDVVRRLLDTGAQCKNCKDDRTTAVMEAMYWGSLNVVRLLKQRGANLLGENDYGSNLLHRAALGAPGRGQRARCIKWVLDNTQIDINSTNNNLCTALCLTLSDNNEHNRNGSDFKSAKLLIQRGANLFVVLNSDFVTQNEYGGIPQIEEKFVLQLLQHAHDLRWASIRPLILFFYAGVDN
jgi:hypothetical protein